MGQATKLVIAETQKKRAEREAVAKRFAAKFPATKVSQREAEYCKRAGCTRQQLEAAAKQFWKETQAAASILNEAVSVAARKPAFFGRVASKVPNKPLTYPVCLFPADDCSSAGQNSCDAASATLKVRDHSSGVGGPFGIEATVTTFPQDAASLYYEIEAPIDGVMTVAPFVNVTGSSYVRADDNGLYDHILTSEGAWASLAMRTIVHSDTQEQRSAANYILNIECENAESAAVKFSNDLFVFTDSFSVLKGQSLVVQISAETYVRGRTDFAHADLDFASGVNGLKLLAACINFSQVVYTGN